MYLICNEHFKEFIECTNRFILKEVEVSEKTKRGNPAQVLVTHQCFLMSSVELASINLPFEEQVAEINTDERDYLNKLGGLGQTRRLGRNLSEVSIWTFFQFF